MIRSAAATCSPLWLPNSSSRRAALTRSKLAIPQRRSASCRAAGDSTRSDSLIDDASPMAAAAASTSANKVSAEALDRALGYPYARPPSSFVWSWHRSDENDDESDESPHGSVHCFDDRGWAFEKEEEGGGGGRGGRPPSAERLAEELRLPLSSARALAAALECVFFEGGEEDGEDNAMTMTPVLAIGSNAGPSQLARKFPRESFPAAAVPVLRAMLRGHDVCYAPLISSYGSVTATLHEVEEEVEPSSSSSSSSSSKSKSTTNTTSVEVWVTFLTPDLLRRMHETEACYDLQRLDCPAGGGGGKGRAREKEKEKPLLLALGTCADSEALGREPAAFLRSALCYTHQAGSLLLPHEHVSAARETHGGERGRGEGEGEGEGEGNKNLETATNKTLVALARAVAAVLLLLLGSAFRWRRRIERADDPDDVPDAVAREAFRDFSSEDLGALVAVVFFFAFFLRMRSFYLQERRLSAT